MSFEELGPTFVKLGQVLATRPDLVPEEYILEFEKLHDRVQTIPFESIKDVLVEEFGNSFFESFQWIDSEPLGSASIAQVHKAILKTGQNVVIKVQRPGIIQKINDDLNVLYFLAELLEKYVPETRPFSPKSIVDEYFKTLELETNFIVEANNIRRFQANFQSEEYVKIPSIYFNFSSERVLVMELLDGVPLSSTSALSQENISAKKIIELALKSYLKMVFIDGFFHGDLHAGNFFILPNNQIGLIDFGVVGRLNLKTQLAIANMLMALSKEDYDRLAYEYVELAPFTDKVDVDLFARELREIIAPFYGLTLKNVNLGKLLMASSGIAARHHVKVPTELMMFFKSIVAIEGLGRKITGDFDFLKYAVEYSNEIGKYHMDPLKIGGELSTLLRESRSLLSSLPRQFNFFIRKLNSPHHSFSLKIDDINDFKKTFEASVNLLFLGIIIGALILSSSLIYSHPTQNIIYGMPALSFIGYIISVSLSLIAFYNYIKKP